MQHKNKGAKSITADVLLSFNFCKSERKGSVKSRRGEIAGLQILSRGGRKTNHDSHKNKHKKQKKESFFSILDLGSLCVKRELDKSSPINLVSSTISSVSMHPDHYM
jgi:hypothetical protein